MDTVEYEPKKETSDHPPSQTAPEPSQKKPRLEMLRDLRPEKDPMGAGRKRP